MKIVIYMLFLVISTLQPNHHIQTEDLIKSRIAFKDWVRRMRQKNKIISFHLRIERGSVAIFKVETKEELDSLLEQWNSFAPVEFAIYPLREEEKK